MLSFLHRLVERYHREHGLHPNLLRRSPRHYRKLLECLPATEDREEVSRCLMMQIVVSPEVAHPCVAWLPKNTGAGLARRREHAC